MHRATKLVKCLSVPSSRAHRVRAVVLCSMNEAYGERKGMDARYMGSHRPRTVCVTHQACVTFYLGVTHQHRRAKHFRHAQKGTNKLLSTCRCPCSAGQGPNRKTCSQNVWGTYVEAAAGTTSQVPPNPKHQHLKRQCKLGWILASHHRVLRFHLTFFNIGFATTIGSTYSREGI